MKKNKQSRIGLRKMKYMAIILTLSLPTICISQVPISAKSKIAMASFKPALELEMNAKGLQFGSPLYIRIFKESKEFEIWVKKGDRFVYFKTYKIYNYGGGTLGPKLKEGDFQAPEGFYSITPQSMNPWSKYHLSLDLGFPNQYDRDNGRTGSAILIHGERCSIGCFAMTNPIIDEIFVLTSASFNNGQLSIPVHIFPFRMTEDNMNQHKSSEWIGFWNNLRDTHDFFEVNHIPPGIEVINKQYVLVVPPNTMKNKKFASNNSKQLNFNPRDTN